jgi:hypothetical protein
MGYLLPAMRIKVLFFLYVLSYTSIFGQKFFQIGTEYMQNGEFSRAEPYLSTSINNRETYQAYYNRAICRLALENIEGACEDLKVMTDRYNDHESMVLYNQYCCSSVDTAFLNRKFKTPKHRCYLYYEVKKYQLYEEDTIGYIRKRWARFDNFMSISNPAGLMFHNQITNIYAKYYLSNDQKVYTYIYKKSPRSESEQNYNVFLSTVKQCIIEHYPMLRKHGNEYIPIAISVLITPEGKVNKLLDLRPMTLHPYIYIRDNVRSDIQMLAQKYLRFQPVRLYRTGVNYEHVIILSIGANNP